MRFQSRDKLRALKKGLLPHDAKQLYGISAREYTAYHSKKENPDAYYRCFLESNEVEKNGAFTPVRSKSGGAVK